MWAAEKENARMGTQKMDAEMVQQDAPGPNQPINRSTVRIPSFSQHQPPERSTTHYSTGARTRVSLVLAGVQPSLPSSRRTFHQTMVSDSPRCITGPSMMVISAPFWM